MYNLIKIMRTSKFYRLAWKWRRKNMGIIIVAGVVALIAWVVYIYAGGLKVN